LSLTEPDVCVTRIRGLKAGAIFFRPCGTEFARGATACPRSDRMGSPVDGEHGIPDNPNGPTPNGVEQICIPCPKLRGSNPPPAAFGGHPRQRGTQDGARIHLRQRGTEEAGRIHPRPRTGTCSKRRPRRDYVSPFEPEGSPDTTTTCLHSCSPERATENSPGFSPEISGATRVSPVRDARK